MHTFDAARSGAQVPIAGSMSQVWDLVVVGAGIAGSALAYSQGQVRMLTTCCSIPIQYV